MQEDKIAVSFSDYSEYAENDSAVSLVKYF